MSPSRSLPICSRRRKAKGNTSSLLSIRVLLYLLWLYNRFTFAELQVPWTGHLWISSVKVVEVLPSKVSKGRNGMPRSSRRVLHVHTIAYAAIDSGWPLYSRNSILWKVALYVWEISTLHWWNLHFSKLYSKSILADSIDRFNRSRSLHRIFLFAQELVRGRFQSFIQCYSFLKIIFKQETLYVLYFFILWHAVFTILLQVNDYLFQTEKILFRRASRSVLGFSRRLRARCNLTR